MMSIPAEEDLTLLFAALNAATSAEIVRRIAAAGHPDLRPAHGYVFQHLMGGPMRVSELGEKLGMTAQGASKLVIELEGLGYVERRGDPGDGRNRYVALTAKGEAGIEAGRAARAAVTAELRAVLGEAAADQVVAGLRQLAEHSGGLAALLGRRLRPQVR
ncbi:MAG: MarR family transcriptional regulator [Thermomicrobiales bacterium]